MKYIPKLFLLATLLLALLMLLPALHEVDEPPPPQISEYQPPPLVKDADADMLPDMDGQVDAAQQGGALEFTPSEQIGADRAVDFPADI